jgi:hypothetical protein
VVFDKCSISFPTVQGTVAVSYDKAGGVMEVTVPEGSRADVVVPGSYAHTSLGPGKHKVRLKVPEPVAAGTYPFQDAGLAVKDLLKRMSVEEGWFEIWLGRNANEKVTGRKVYIN